MQVWAMHVRSLQGVISCLMSSGIWYILIASSLHLLSAIISDTSAIFSHHLCVDQKPHMFIFIVSLASMLNNIYCILA